MLLNKKISEASVKICSRCIYDERTGGIQFNEKDLCNYCLQIDALRDDYGTGEKKGIRILEGIIGEIKQDGRGNKYDCVIGVSGGTDSSYLVYLAKKWGLRPLAVHYDNTWNSAIATMNIHKVLGALDVDLCTHVVNNKVADDIFRAFFFAGVAEIDAATDLGYAYLLRQIAANHSIKFVLEGHSFVNEGITPLNKNYFDGRYIKAIHKRYGRLPMHTYPLMTFFRFLKSAIVDRVKFIRPMWYLDYSKKKAMELLSQKYGWEYYGGHHLENRITAFYHGVYLPQKFKTDLRSNTLSAQVRMGEKTREEAWAEYNTSPKVEEDLLEYFKKRLAISNEQYERIMGESPKSWQDYPTYKKRFERLRPLFAILARANLVPMSFYLKYCFPAAE